VAASGAGAPTGLAGRDLPSTTDCPMRRRSVSRETSRAIAVGQFATCATATRHPMFTFVQVETNRTLATEWTHRQVFTSKPDRAAALPDFLE
jgi:hypothetical protein